jgi:hypothetical protein
MKELRALHTGLPTLTHSAVAHLVSSFIDKEALYSASPAETLCVRTGKNISLIDMSPAYSR